MLKVVSIFLSIYLSMKARIKQQKKSVWQHSKLGGMEMVTLPMFWIKNLSNRESILWVQL